VVLLRRRDVVRWRVGAEGLSWRGEEQLLRWRWRDVVQRVLEHGRWSSICRAWVGHGVRRERVHSRQSLRRARAQQPWKTRASVRPGLDVAGPGALLGGLRRAGAVGGVAAVVGDALALRLPLVRRRRGRGGGRWSTGVRGLGRGRG
jgi:hypothetical protein